ATGLEPAASWSQTKHSTKLSYASSSTGVIIYHLFLFVNTFFDIFLKKIKKRYFPRFRHPFALQNLPIYQLFT
ncbi:hypothetical protein, partial [Negativibacillus massiliensis]|uniref:hypothetical protein n=1 Tax=Negativibacillus massiliensis TaxID=1871035 RepID=UPI0023FA2AA0